MTESTDDSSFHLDTLEALHAHYGAVNPRSLEKEIDYISEHYRAYIERSPFVVLASAGPEGLDCSPRGDPPGFVRIEDEKTVLLPDRPGNNRLDSLRNLIRDPRVALLFLIPGAGETLRINGRAEIRVDPDLLASFAIRDRPPRSVIRVHVERVYFQCQKALVRSRLWQSDAQVANGELPSAGQILASLSNETLDADEYDRSYPARLAKTMY